MRYASKAALLKRIRAEHTAFCARLAEIPSSQYRQAGVWGDGWTVADLIAHLAEWHRLFLHWYSEGEEGRTPQMPAPGYKWNETPRLNRAIWAKHQARSTRASRADFEAGFREINALVERLSAEEILEPGHFRWTRKQPLATYIGANTASHYRFASNVLTRWQRRASLAHSKYGPTTPESR